MIVIACDKCKKTNVETTVVGIEITYKIDWDDEKERNTRKGILALNVVDAGSVKTQRTREKDSYHICIECKTKLESESFSNEQPKKLPKTVEG